MQFVFVFVFFLSIHLVVFCADLWYSRIMPIKTNFGMLQGSLEMFLIISKTNFGMFQGGFLCVCARLWIFCFRHFKKTNFGMFQCLKMCVTYVFVNPYKSKETFKAKFCIKQSWDAYTFIALFSCKRPAALFFLMNNI